MINREEEQCQIGEPWIRQEEAPPSLLKQTIIGIAFFGFILSVPTVIMKLSRVPTG